MEAEIEVTVTVNGKTPFSKELKIENGNLSNLKQMLYKACELLSKDACNYITSLSDS